MWKIILLDTENVYTKVNAGRCDDHWSETPVSSTVGIVLVEGVCGSL